MRVARAMNQFLHRTSPKQLLGCAFAAMLSACSQQPGPTAPSGSAAEPLLASSTPADGAVLSLAPRNVTLKFAHPVQLLEVSAIGSNGLSMPIMVTSAGAQTDYSIPVDGLSAGAYTIAWRVALTEGRTAAGEFRFTVR